MITDEAALPPPSLEELEELTGRCLSAQEQIFAGLVRALPPRSKEPLRDLSLDQLDLLLRIPDDGCPVEELVAARGGDPAATRPSLAALRRRRLLSPGPVADRPWVELTPRGQSCRTDLRLIHRSVLREALGKLSPAQLLGLLRVDGVGAATSDPPSLDSLVDQLLALRTGIASILGASLSGEPGLGAGIVTLHQQQALSLLPREGATMREFARLLAITHGSATALADRMVRQGLLERRYDEQDRRLVRVLPTPRALEVRERLRRLQRDAVGALLGRLSERQRTVLSEVADLLGRGRSPLP